ncbi:hypothetical protein ACFSQ0_09220 [Mesonia sediminis]|uniref:SGNH/GDSL hydrolase family protein n=1 Tax=Mesonia sediminis TaxID=1703946 RepID=A0ABW5SET8_9FLAO
MIKKFNYFFVIFVLAIISVIKFINDNRKDYFFRHRFDLTNIEYLESYTVEVLDYSYNQLTISNNDLKLEPNQTYALTNAANEQFIFAFSSSEIKDNKIFLNNLVWYFKKPLGDIENAKLSKINLPTKIKDGSVKVAMLTGQFGCCMMHGKKFRYFWQEKNPNVQFKGTEKDVYSYSYYGGAAANSSSLLKESRAIEPADVYVIWTGRNEKNSDLLANNIQQIHRNLKRISPEAEIILIYPSPSPVPELDENISLNVKCLDALDLKGIKKIDIYSLFKSKENWQNYYFDYEYALSKKAYLEIVNLLNDEI